MNHVGFDLNDAYFYVKTSNVSNVARFGSTTSSGAISIYNNSDEATSYLIGVENPIDPIFWIGKSQGASNENVKKLLHIHAQTGFIGVGTDRPAFSMDIYGDIHLTGQLVQEGCNVIINTQTIQSTISSTESISVSSNVDAIDFTGSAIKNVGTARFNCNVYVGDTIFASNINIWGNFFTSNSVIYDTERILVNNSGDGPALQVQQNGEFPVAHLYSNSNIALSINEIGNVGVGTIAPVSPLHVVGTFRIDDGVSIQQMGSLQKISASAGQVLITTTGTHELGFTFTWQNTGLTELQMMEADMTFYGSGPQTRVFMQFGQFINPVDNGTTSPGGDIVTNYKLVKYKSYPNIIYVKNNIVRNGPKSVKIRVIWASRVATNYVVNMNIDILVPKQLGFSSITSYYTQQSV